MITVWNRFVQLKGVGKPVQERVQIQAHLVFVFCTCQQVCKDPTPLLFVFSPCQQVCLDPTPVMFVFLSVSTSLPESRPLSCLVSPCQQICQNPGPSHVCCLCQHLCQDPLLSCLFSVPVNRFASVSASLLKSRPLSCLLSFSVNRFAKIQAPLMQRRSALDKVKRIHQFMRDVEDEKLWIQEMMPRATATNYGNSLLSVQLLIKKNHVSAWCLWSVVLRHSLLVLGHWNGRCHFKCGKCIFHASEEKNMLVKNEQAVSCLYTYSVKVWTVV